MGSCCGCCEPKKGVRDKNSLRRAQTLTKTSRGKPVNSVVKYQFYTKTELQMLKRPHKRSHELWKDIFTRPLNEFNKITGNLFLTGMGGICEENIRANDIKCLINATHELVKFEVEGIESFRIPVEDSYFEDLVPYFDDLSDKLEDNNKKDIKTVIYCMGGVSRSSTFVIAYLMKYRKFKFKEAFSYVTTRRSVVLPNKSFVRQLSEYERKLYKRNYFNNIEIEDKNGVKTVVPDFLLKYYIGSTETTETDPEQDFDENIDMKLSANYKEINHLS